MNVTVDRASGHDLSVAGQNFSGWPDHKRRVDVVHRVRIASLANADDTAILDPDICLHDAPVIEDHGTGDDEVGCSLTACTRGLAHRLTNHLAAAEHDLVAACAVVLRDFNPQVGVGESDPVSTGGSVQISVPGAIDPAH